MGAPFVEFMQRFNTGRGQMKRPAAPNPLAPLPGASVESIVVIRAWLQRLPDSGSRHRAILPGPFLGGLDTPEAVTMRGLARR